MFNLDCAPADHCRRRARNGRPPRRGSSPHGCEKSSSGARNCADEPWPRRDHRLHCESLSQNLNVQRERGSYSHVKPPDDSAVAISTRAIPMNCFR
jgi:hypothetical protein